MGKFSDVLIATDLDGTMLDSNKRVGAKTLAALDRYIAQGGRLTVSTGRVYSSFGNMRKLVPFNMPVIFANGAQLYDYETDRTVWGCLVDETSLDMFSGVASRFPEIAIEIYRHKLCDVVNLNARSLEHMERFHIPYSVCSSPSEIPFPWLKALFVGEHEDLLQVAECVEAYKCDLKYRFSTPYFLEAFNKNTDKGIAVLKLAEMYRIDRKNIYTAGDQENDIDMLKVAAISFAPDNAVNAVKSQADVILPDNEHDTIAALIEHLEKIY